MPISTNTGTRDIPLQFAKQLSEIVNQEWESGSFIQKVTPVTQDLLRYWFNPVFCETRVINFHKGQKQAILNAIYCHEILKIDSILSMYQQASQDLLSPNFFNYIANDKFQYPKYCVKMATGTGKTFVLNALLIWQYLNAKFKEVENNVKYTKNFLLVAPGLIVYERLLDAFLGKEQEDGTRDFLSSDIKRNENLFIPERYRQTVFSFIQNNVVKKDEIGKKITGDGLIAITNWHLLAGVEETIEDTKVSPLQDPSNIVKDLLPITPGVTAGHDLNIIDNKYLKGGELEYLQSLENICVFNDEAHHIHENKQNGLVAEVEWQKSLNFISENKGKNFIQIDFSATPYSVTGSGQKRTKHYFPHIIVDFALKEAIREGLVKTIAIDKRKEIATIENEDLDFKAKKDGANVIDLSDGQRLMIRAGLAKLKLLEEEFVKEAENKHPKMLIMCENTKASPFVIDFLKQEGLADDEIIQIDTDKQGEVSVKEWATIKQRLFNVDKHSNPKVIVSVLMLREGFDVSNICVIVPLRSAQSNILLEQTIGRGLRLMWREKDYQDIKAENRHKMFIEKQSPVNYLDILSIIEHPAFIQFYDDLENGMIVEEKEMPPKESVLGDIITVGLKENYEKYDFYIPTIVSDKEEILKLGELETSNFNKLPWSLSQLKEIVKNYGDESFYSEEMTVKTRFGDYRVSSRLFNAKSYNEFLARMLDAITNNMARIAGHSSYPAMQINQVALVEVIDKYIRTQLFGEKFDPSTENNWRVLLVAKVGILEHIMKEISKSIYDMQNSIEISEATVMKKYFSEVDKIKMRENFALDIQKSIYEKTAYPSNKGDFEKDFLIFADKDSQVERLLKINENYHMFANLKYIRTDGLFSSYYPDFLVKIEDSIYFVETKAQKDVEQTNIKQKQRSALDWCKKVNELRPEERMFSTWRYSILDDNTFYSMQARGASTLDLLEYCKLTNGKIEGKLF
ncbi:MAG: DEAD/DEAH box helicase family protein [Candidatus Gastranaerophilales bacterium]|nr:DEAD/DEAH box helicase family protein [Candidatus Gastranaerophilales bacterium]